jgi:hypothetical protein
VITEIGRSEDFFVRSFCACLDDMLAVNALAGPFDFYLFSLSRHRDHAAQWRSFGGDGSGYALGLAPSLFQVDRDDLYDEANRNLHIGRVIYGEHATAERHRLSVARAAEIASRVGHAHPGLVHEVSCSRYLAMMAHELLASQLIWNCLTAKDDRYADEREVRGIMMNVRARFDPFRRTHGGRDYVEHALPLGTAGSITEIMVGPGAPAGAEADIGTFLTGQGYPGSIPVTRSAAVMAGITA